MGLSYRDKEYIYIAELDGGKCSTYQGFIYELEEAFSIPFNCDNINDVEYYIFFNFIGERKIKFIVKNTKKLIKKEKQYEYVKETLYRWKDFYEKEYDFQIDIVV